MHLFVLSRYTPTVALEKSPSTLLGLRLASTVTAPEDVCYAPHVIVAHPLFAPTSVVIARSTTHRDTLSLVLALLCHKPRRPRTPAQDTVLLASPNSDRMYFARARAHMPNPLSYLALLRWASMRT